MKTVLVGLIALIFSSLIVLCSPAAFAQDNPGTVEQNPAVIPQSADTLISVSLVDLSGKAVDFRSFIPAPEKLTTKKRIELYFADTLKKFLAIAVAGSFGAFIFCLILPHWHFLTKIKALGMLLSFLVLLVSGFVFFKIETDKKFYDRAIATFPRFAAPKEPPLPPGQLILSKEEGAVNLIAIKPEGVYLPELGRYKLQNISDINGEKTTLDLDQATKVLTWDTIQKAKSKTGKVVEFLLEPLQPPVFGIDDKKEKEVSTAAFEELKKEFAKSRKAPKSAKASYKHYYYDEDENLVGRVEEAGNKKLNTGVWEDALGQKKTYPVPYMKIKEGDPEAHFYHFIDAGTKENWALYVAALPEQVKPNVKSLGEWFKSQMPANDDVLHLQVPENFCESHYFLFGSGERLYCTQDAWKNWLATLRAAKTSSY